jgi:hypothetical protein
VNAWSTKKAYLYLIGSTFLTLTLSLGGYSFFKNLQKKREVSESYKITKVLQTGPEKEALKTAYLVELLGLSADKPASLYAFDLKCGEKRLLSSPLIASVKLKRVPPSTLYIDYEVRKPVAQLADCKNIGVDKEGFLFPLTPFFSPKNLPEIYLGTDDFSSWKVEGAPFKLALEILQFLESAPWKEGLQIKRIDVSKAFCPSLGVREIVLLTEEEVSLRRGDHEVICQFPKILRIAPKDYGQQLRNFFALRRTMMDQYKQQLSLLKEGGRFAPRIIDLRIAQLAFVEKG